MMKNIRIDQNTFARPRETFRAPSWLRITMIAAIVVLNFVSCSDKKPATAHPDIIPVPEHAELKKGNFRIKLSTRIQLSTAGEQAMTVAKGLSDRLKPFLGKDLTIEQATSKAGRNSIFLNLVPDLELGDEGYQMTVKSSRIEITAQNPAGLFYGVQTLYQLLPPEIYTLNFSADSKDVTLSVPCIEITDQPAFPWRGMHLDVSRHFFPKEFVKKYIDLIAMHKMNTFHWHLTDDNGWRIAIDQYPLLTEVAAWRADRTGIPWGERLPQQPGEETTFGGFYTKDDIREIVRYAADRFVTIIPEIEMPGHTSEVFAAYPGFSCTGERTTVQTGSYWPNDHIFCAGKEETFRFLENVMDEVFELFPSEYIHIGGDEADKSAWKSCPLCKARIRNEGLKDVEGLQSYFVKRIEKYLHSKGRKLIGWDEILEGGLAPDATVMSWRGYEGGIEAAKMGHQVIMCPTSHCYFDYYQADPDFQPEAIGGFTTLKKVYSFHPVPSELSPAEAKLVLGGQGNLWTEYISTTSHAEYMALPRMAALAEVLWSPENKREWYAFRERLQAQLKRFDQLDVKYGGGSARVEAIPLFGHDDKPYSIKLETEVKDVDIFYTLDGREPGNHTFPYKNPLEITRNITLNAIAFKGGKPFEKPASYRIVFHQGIGRNIIYREKVSERYQASGPSGLLDGLKGSLKYNDGLWQGFNGNNLDVLIQLDKEIAISTISVTFLQDQQKWIFLPRKVHFYMSEDGKVFHEIGGSGHNISMQEITATTHDFKIKLNPPLRMNYIRIVAENIGVCPDWHPGSGGKVWLFADEIVINE